MTKVTTYEELAAALQAGETYISVSETLKAPCICNTQHGL